MAKRSLIGVLVLVPITFAVWIIGYHLHLKSGFAAIEHGDTQRRVEQLLGEPHDVIGCGQFGGAPPTGCAKGFSYLSLLAFTDVWVIDFDAEGRVVRKLRYRSP
jgi:hypothetical protein